MPHTRLDFLMKEIPSLLNQQPTQQHLSLHSSAQLLLALNTANIQISTDTLPGLLPSSGEIVGEKLDRLPNSLFARKTKGKNGLDVDADERMLADSDFNSGSAASDSSSSQLAASLTGGKFSANYIIASTSSSTATTTTTTTTTVNSVTYPTTVTPFLSSKLASMNGNVGIDNYVQLTHLKNQPFLEGVLTQDIWVNNITPSMPLRFTYTFWDYAQIEQQNGTGTVNPQVKQFGTWTETAKALTRTMLEQFSNVANISFQEVNYNTGLKGVFFNNNSDFSFFLVGNVDPSAGGWATFPGMTDQYAETKSIFGIPASQPWLTAPGDFFLNNSSSGFTNSALMQPGMSFESYLLVHEFGHSLGLKHPHDRGAGTFKTFKELYLEQAANYLASGVQNNGINNALKVSTYINGLPPLYSYNTTNTSITNIDNTFYTVMSYSSPLELIPPGYGPGNAMVTGAYVYQPMMFDVAALQLLYGANLKFKTGNDIYPLTQIIPDLTNTTRNNGDLTNLWDAGGIDTLNGTGNNFNMLINLNAGGFTQYGQYQVMSISFGVTIENANGGNGNDTIIGNAVDNVIFGGAGNDTIDGGAGNDTLTGGLGTDTLLGGLGNDLFIASTDGFDKVNGGAGVNTLSFQAFTNASLALKLDLTSNVFTANNVSLNNTILAANSIQNIIGGNANDIITGNASNNTLTGGIGNDTLDGKAGADKLIGGDGNDLMLFDPLDLQVAGQLGIDTLKFDTDDLAINFTDTDYSEYGYTDFDYASGIELLDISGKLSSGSPNYIILDKNDLLVSQPGSLLAAPALNTSAKLVITGHANDDFVSLENGTDGLWTNKGAVAAVNGLSIAVNLWVHTTNGIADGAAVYINRLLDTEAF